MDADPTTGAGDGGQTRDERISELATGFALGELSDADLREFYDFLRDPREGSSAASLAWQQLGVVTDLRAGMGTAFQDTVKHRLDLEGRSDRFTRTARSRLGNARPSLEPVAMPESRRQLRLAPLLLIAGAIFIAALVFAARHGRGTAGETLCRVLEVEGEASLGGGALVAGSNVDHRQVVVPGGSQLVLAWSDGSLAVLAGPANAVAQSAGISLTNGGAWIVAANQFVCGLPDDTVRAEAGCRVALSVVDNRSVVGVSSGTASLTSRTLKAGEAASSSIPYAWTNWAAADGAHAPHPEPSPDWVLDGTLAWDEHAEGADVGIADGSLNGLLLTLSPGTMQVTRSRASSSGPRTVPLPGAPLGQLTLRFAASHRHLTLASGTMLLLQEDIPAATAISIGPANARLLQGLRFHNGPAPHPPLPVHAQAWLAGAETSPP